MNNEMCKIDLVCFRSWKDAFQFRKTVIRIVTVNGVTRRNTLKGIFRSQPEGSASNHDYIRDPLKKLSEFGLGTIFKKT